MLAISAVANIGNHRRRHDLLTVKTAVTAHRLTKSRKVTQRGVQPTAARLGADAVYLIQRVVFAAEF